MDVFVFEVISPHVLNPRGHLTKMVTMSICKMFKSHLASRKQIRMFQSGRDYKLCIRYSGFLHVNTDF